MGLVWSDVKLSERFVVLSCGFRLIANCWGRGTDTELISCWEDRLTDQKNPPFSCQYAK